MNTIASAWVAQQHLEYSKSLLNSLSISEIARRSQDAEFFHELHKFYSLRILHNLDIQSERCKVASSLQKNTIWQEFISKSENLHIRVSLNRNQSRKLASENFLNYRILLSYIFRLTKKMVHRRIINFAVRFFNLDSVNSRVQHFIAQKPDYVVRIEGHTFTKIEIVALVELLLHFCQESIAKNVLTQTRILFANEPDNLWSDHILLRCEQSIRNDSGSFVYKSQTYNTFRLEVISVDASVMTFNLDSYIVEKDTVITFENRVSTFKSKIPKEENCVSISKLSFISKNNSLTINQGEFFSPRDFFLGPIGRSLVGLNKNGMLASKVEGKQSYSGHLVPFLLSSGGSSNYWHALVEALPRLVNLDEDQPIIWIGEPPKYVTDIIAMLKPQARVFTFPSSGVTLEKIKISPLSVMSYEPFWESEVPHFDPDTLKQFRHELLSKFQEMTDWNSGLRAAKVFLLRKSTHRRSESDSFVAALKDAGFVVVDPSRMRVIDQAKLFSSAQVLVGEVGAVWANLIFSNPGTKVFSLCSEPSAPTPLFGGFAQILGIDFHPIVLPSNWKYDPRSHWNNTQEAFYQSGFVLNEELKNRALTYIFSNL